MIRTTVMLPEEMHAKLRRIARRRGMPLAAVIREALTEAAESESRERLPFIGAVSVDVGPFSASTAETLPPIAPPVSDISPEELEELRRRFAERGEGC